MIKTKIYVLKDPRNDKIRYLGKTIKSLDKRLKEHCNIKNNSRKDNWIKQLKNNNLKPIIELLDEVDNSEWIFWEQFWITILKILKCDLTNLTNGGNGAIGYKPDKKSIELRLDKLRKKVKVYDLSGNLLNIYNSIRDCSNALNINKSHISECMNNKNNVKSIKGYVFRKVENTFHSIDFRNNSKKEILQCDKNGVTIKKWNSIKQAADSFGVKSPNISRALRGERKTYKGFIWKYYN